MEALWNNTMLKKERREFFEDKCRLEIQVDVLKRKADFFEEYFLLKHWGGWSGYVISQLLGSNPELWQNAKLKRFLPCDCCNKQIDLGTPTWNLHRPMFWELQPCPRCARYVCHHTGGSNWVTDCRVNDLDGNWVGCAICLPAD